MKRVRYTGTAPGQSGCVRISGEEYRRGEQYDVTDRRAAKLMRAGGFVVVDDQQAAAVAPTEEEA
jgi:hypothetical protein